MTGIVEPSGNAQPLLSPSKTPMLLLGLALATGMEFYTFDSMNLVLTDLTGSLGVSPDEASWLLTIYSCTLFLGVPISTWLAGHFGYKRYLISTVILFAGSSIGIFLSSSLKLMLFWRAVQGGAGAGLVVWWRAGVYLLLPRPQRGSSLMRISTGLYLSSVLGLLLAGYLTDQYSWHLLFVPNLLMAAGAVWILYHVFPDLPPAKTERLRRTDWPGLLLLALGVICLQIVLSRGVIDDWFGSPHIKVLAILMLAAILGFGLWEISPQNPHPLLDIGLLFDRNVLASAFIGTCTGMILSGSLFVLPRFLRSTDPQTHSATQTGQIICIYALTAAALRPIVTRAIANFGPRKIITVAISLLIISMLLLNYWLTTGTSDGYYLIPLVLYGLCLAPLLPTVGGGTVARIDQNRLLDGVSLYMAFRQFGASLGVALITILLESRETLHSSRLFEHLRLNRIGIRDRLLESKSYLAAHAGTGLSSASRASIALLRGSGFKQAVTLSYADIFLFMAFVGVVTLCLLPLIPPPAPTPAQPTGKTT